MDTPITIALRAPKGMVRTVGFDARGQGYYLIDDVPESELTEKVRLASEHNLACREGDDSYRVYDDTGADLTRP